MGDLSFLAPPDEVADWRYVVLIATAAEAGMLDALPGRPAAIAASLGLDPHSVRVLLDALEPWGVVAHQDGTYHPGPDFPDDDTLATIAQHAQFLGRWSSDLGDRLRQPVLTEPRTRPPQAEAAWLSALGVRAREQAPAIIDRCLQFVPGAEAVLDVAGGHGEYGIEVARRGRDVTLLDLPEVIDVVRDWPRVRDSGIDLLPGDAFRPPPAGPFDLVLCFGFTHTQPAARLPELFTRLYDLTRPGGGLAIHTFLHGRGPVPALFSVQMLVAGNGGASHRLDQYEAALAEAGFEQPTVADVGGRSLLLARRS